MPESSRFPSAEAYAAETARHSASERVDLPAEQAGMRDAYGNRVMLDFNDHCLRLAVFEGPYRWHRHADSDELFLVMEGALEIERADGETVRLLPGQCYVVPAGTVHRTRGIGRTVNLTCEKRGARTEFVEPPGGAMASGATARGGAQLAPDEDSG